ncbi:MAG: DUF3106 domain-containing protein [Burkholderiaceae bacterium]|nr:MAG: DUF3106 domain-containing protein [Burkholderiaceae bacterium]
MAFGPVQRVAAVLALTACTTVFARAAPAPAPGVAPAAKAASAPRPLTRPAPANDNITLWNELGPAEQRALRPLAASWAQLDEAQRRKWRALAKDFDRMPPAEQALLQTRMTEWAALSPRQRAGAAELCPDQEPARRGQARAVGGLPVAEPGRAAPPRGQRAQAAQGRGARAQAGVVGQAGQAAAQGAGAAGASGTRPGPGPCRFHGAAADHAPAVDRSANPVAAAL